MLKKVKLATLAVFTFLLFFILPKLPKHRYDITVVMSTMVGKIGFPNVHKRVKFGSADGWREDIYMIESEILDPIALQTFYMLKTGTDVMWERLPIHLETTLKRFPYHQIYSDGNGQIGNETIIDIIEMLPQSLINNVQLEGYRDHKVLYEEAWGWNPNHMLKSELTSGWNIDKFKNIPMIYHAYKNAPKHCNWFVFADDDTYIHSQSLGSLLSNLNPKHKHYIGSRALIEGGFAMSGKVGQKRLKNNDPNEPKGLLFAHGGSGVVVSRGTLDALFWDEQREIDTVNKYSELAIHTCCGDAMFGYMLREELELNVNDLILKDELEIDPFFGENVGMTPISVAGNGWCKRIIAWHHLEPQNIQQFFDWENSINKRRSLQSIMFSDVYVDFVLPFIQPVMEFWRIVAWADEYNGKEQLFFVEENVMEEFNETEKEMIDSLVDFSPASNAENCKYACEIHPKCLGYFYSQSHLEQELNRCVLEHTVVSRGINTHPFLGTDDSQQYVVSGYMVERIRKLRTQEECDWLKFDNVTMKYNDREDEREGWYFNELLKEQEGKTDEPVYFI